MSQYFTAAILSPSGDIIRAVEPGDYGCDPSIGTHSRGDSPFHRAVETLLALDGGGRLVWGGDYDDTDDAVWCRVRDEHYVRFEGLIDPERCQPNTPLPLTISDTVHRYVCNRDRHEYLDKARMHTGIWGELRTPLPGLVAEGHDGRTFIGPWARQHIYITSLHPGNGWTDITRG